MEKSHSFLEEVPVLKSGGRKESCFSVPVTEISGPLMDDTHPYWSTLLASGVNCHHFSKWPPSPEKWVFILTRACKHAFDEDTAAPETLCSDKPVTPGLPTPQSWLVTSFQLMYSYTITPGVSVPTQNESNSLMHEGEITACLLLPGDLRPQT